MAAAASSPCSIRSPSLLRTLGLGVWAAALTGSAATAVAAAPGEQQAIVQTGNGGPEVLTLQSIPVLRPGDHQVLIRVYAAAVNPTDWKMRIGPSPGAAPPVADAATPDRRIPGLDVAGVIESIGTGVTDLHVGEAVFSLIGRTVPGLNGGYSQYVVAPAENVVPKPKQLTYAEAAGIGVAGRTAERSVEQAQLQRGQRVLITGVAGGVGSAAAQIAKAHGAYVFGTAQPVHTAFLKSIGVDKVIDYKQPSWTDQAKNVDVVIDTVGADTATTALGLVKRGGVFITIASRDITPAMCSAAGVTCPYVGAPRAGDPSEGDYLRPVAKLIEAGKFSVHIDKTYPLASAADAQEYNRGGHTEGKIILIVSDRASQK
jgi:NADPH:quinone reductase-like Zn-dependent oxidoreductase